MKLLIKTLAILLVVYFGLSIGIRAIHKGHEITYTFARNKQNITIQETYLTNTKHEKTNYSFHITLGKKSFDFQTFENFHGAKQVIIDLKYITDQDYTCILPIYRGDKIISDLICQYDDLNFLYHTIQGNNPSLDKKVESLKKDGYQLNAFADDLKKPKKEKYLTLYLEQIPNQYQLFMTDYSGLTTIDKNGASHMKLFDHDIYKRNISAFIQDYYITADYSQTYDFQNFYLVHLSTGKKELLPTKVTISLDSYMNGIVDDILYITDRSNERQYAVDIKNKIVREVGNEIKGMQYYELGNWTTVPSARMLLSEQYFTNKQVLDSKFVLFKDSTGKKSGYQYWYRNQGNGYEIYRSNIQNKENKLYLFTVSSLEEVCIVDDYVFAKYDNFIYVYQDAMGLKTILSNTEFSFNDNIRFYASKK